MSEEEREYSVVETKRRLPSLIHAVEARRGPAIYLTRREASTMNAAQRSALRHVRFDPGAWGQRDAFRPTLSMGRLPLAVRRQRVGDEGTGRLTRGGFR